MKLDKDIHQRLVNPQPNNTLETNVRNVLVALNGRAPYDKLIKMIEAIKVWLSALFSDGDEYVELTSSLNDLNVRRIISSLKKKKF